MYKAYQNQGFVPKHPNSQVPNSFYEPKQKQQPVPSSKPPSLDDFFPAKKKEPNIRPVPGHTPSQAAPPKPTPKPAQRPPKQAPKAPYQPPVNAKKQLQSVFDNMTSADKKRNDSRPTVYDLETKKNIDFGAKETIAHHLKNTNQRMDALDEVNALIHGVTDLAYLDQDQERADTFPTSENDTEVYG